MLKNIPESAIYTIRHMIIEGISKEIIIKKFRLTIKEFYQLHEKFSHLIDEHRLCLGSKKEPYMTEEQMLNGFTVNPSELKGWELEMFNKPNYEIKNNPNNHI